MAKKTNTSSEKKYLKYFLAFILSIILILVAFFFQKELSGFGKWGLLGIFIVNFFSTVTLFLPNFSAATVVAGGNLYNPMLVAIAATLGGALGDASSFVLGRSGKEIFIKKEGRVFQIAVDVFQKHGFIIIFLFALIPNPIFDAIGIFAGISKYPFTKYFLAMVSGRIFRNLLLAYLGKAL